MNEKIDEKFYDHWIDELVDNIISNWPKVDTFNCNCGISVSGKQHVGRLRGEIVLTNAVTQELKNKGFKANHSLILYTSDPWKGKESQLKAFGDSKEGEKYINRRLVDVPSPDSPDERWIDYYWKEFGIPLPLFAKDVQITYTHELYKEERTKKFVKLIISKKDPIRQILNKYRSDNPLPEDWIPINALCDKCGQIGNTKALEVDIDFYKVKYFCSNCKSEGWSSIEVGKLTWRLEWLAIWYLLNIHFEPYGKDHATPGGSRDSCIEILEEIFSHKGPYGYWNEWVGYSEGRTDFGDMSSSSFIGFTPTTWNKYADPEVIKYLYLKNPAHRRIVLGLDKIPSYINEFDKAERIYHGLEELTNESEMKKVIRSLELTYYNKVPEYRGFQLEYLHAAILTQLVKPTKEGTLTAIKKIEESFLGRKIDKDRNFDYVNSRLKKANQWINDEGPSHLKIEILQELNDEILAVIPKNCIELIEELFTNLNKDKWTEESIKNGMITVRDNHSLSRKQMKELFNSLYLTFLGRSQGPRLAPLLASLEKKWVLDRLKLIIKKNGS